MATKWWDVATYDGPMSVSAPEKQPSPGAGGISAWVADLRRKQQAEIARAKKLEEERRREAERQRMRAEAAAKVQARIAADIAKSREMQVERPPTLTERVAALDSTAPSGDTMAYRPPASAAYGPVQGPQARPMDSGLSAWMPAGSKNPLQPENTLKNTVSRWLDPALSQYEDIRQARDTGYLRQLQANRVQAQRAKQPTEGGMESTTSTTPYSYTPSSASGLSKEDEERRREIYTTGSPSTVTTVDVGAVDRNLERSVPGYKTAKAAVGSALQTAGTHLGYGVQGLFDPLQFLSDTWRGVGTEDVMASDVYGAIRKGMTDTIAEMGDEPTTFIQRMEANNPGFSPGLALFRTLGLDAQKFGVKFYGNYLPALDAMVEGRTLPGPKSQEQYETEKKLAVLLTEESRVQAANKITNQEKAIGRMLYAAGQYYAKAWSPYVGNQYGAPSTAWNQSGMNQKEWSEANLAISSYLGKKAMEMVAETPATIVEANRPILDELITGLAGFIEPTDWIAGGAKLLRLTPKQRAFSTTLARMSFGEGEAVRLLGEANAKAVGLVGADLGKKNPISQFFTLTREAQALIQADNIYRTATTLIGTVETADDAKLILRTLKNRPQDLVTGIPASSLSSPRLQALAAEDGLVRFGDWLASEPVRESQKVLVRIEDDVLDAMVPGVPLYDPLAKAQTLDNLRAGTRSASLRSYGATVNGVADDIPYGLVSARAVQEKGVWKVAYDGPGGTTIRVSEPMTQKEALAVVEKAKRIDEVSTNVIRRFANVQRKVMTASWLNTRPGHWVRNAVSLAGHLFMDDGWSWANKNEIAEYFTRITGGVQSPTSRIAEGAGGIEEHMLGRNGTNVISRANRRLAGIWTGNTEIPLGFGKSVNVGEQNGYNKGFYRYFKDYLEDATDRLMANAPDTVHPSLVAGLKHAALKDGEAGIAKYLSGVEQTFRPGFSPPPTIRYPMDSMSPKMWDEVEQLFSTATSADEYRKGLSSIFSRNAGNFQEQIRIDPPPIGRRTFTSVDSAEDLAEHLQEIEAIGRRAGADPDVIENAKSAARQEYQQYQGESSALHKQISQALSQSGDADALMRVVDVHEDVYRIVAKARIRQGKLVQAAMEEGTPQAWEAYGVARSELWRNTYQQSLEAYQDALDVVTGKTPAGVRPTRRALLERSLEWKDSAIEEARQYSRLDAGDATGFAKKIDAQRAAVDKAVARNSFVARQIINSDTMDELFDMYVYMRNIDNNFAAQANRALEAYLAAKNVGAGQAAWRRYVTETDRIWTEHTDTKVHYIDTVTYSLARRLGGVENVSDDVLQIADTGVAEILQEAERVASATVEEVAPASRQALEEELAELQEQLVERAFAKGKQAEAEAAALADRVSEIQKQLDTMPAEAAPAADRGMRPAFTEQQARDFFPQEQADEMLQPARPEAPAPKQKPVASTATTAQPTAPTKPDLTPLREAAARIGVATSTEDGRPLNQWLVNWINKHAGLGNPIKSLDDLDDVQVQQVIRTMDARPKPKAKAKGVSQPAPKPARPEMGQYPEGVPVTALIEDTTRKQAERQGLIEARRTMLEQWDRAAARWDGVPSAQQLARKLGAGKGGTSDLRIDGVDWQSWGPLQDFADALLGPGAKPDDVRKWLDDYAALNRQLGDIQGSFNAVKQGDESLSQAMRRLEGEAKPDVAINRLSRREVMAQYGDQLKEAGYTNAELSKMRVAELKDAVRSLLDTPGTAFTSYESTFPRYIPDKGTPLPEYMRTGFGLEKGVSLSDAYLQNSRALGKSNAASLTTADIGAFHLRNLEEAFEELWKMGDDMFNAQTVNRADVANFSQWVRNSVVPGWRNNMAQSIEAAKQAADFSALNYSRIYGFDTFINALVPYHIYQTRTFKNSIRRIMTRPDILAQYMATERAIQRNNERNDKRPRMEGRIPIPGTDGYGIMSPLRYFLPFWGVLPRPVWDSDTLKDMTLAEKLLTGENQFGVSGMPLYQLMYTMATGKGQVRALIPHTQVFINLARAAGADVPYMKSSPLTQALGLTDDWDADRIVRAVGTLQQEGTMPDEIAGWLLDYIGIKTGKVAGPLPEMPDGLEDYFKQAEGRAMGDNNVRVLSNFLLGMGITRQPESETEIYSDMNDFFGMQYDPVENPFGSHGGRQPTPAASTFMGRGFFYPDNDPGNITAIIDRMLKDGDMPANVAQFFKGYVATKTGETEGPLPDYPDYVSEWLAENQGSDTSGVQLLIDFIGRDRPGIWAATNDYFAALRPLIEQREAAIEELYRENPEDASEQERKIRAEFDAAKEELQSQFPSAKTDSFGSTVKSGMGPTEAKYATFKDLSTWFLYNFPGYPKSPGNDAGFGAWSKWRADMAKWEQERANALSLLLQQAGLSAFAMGRSGEQVLADTFRESTTKSEGVVKAEKGQRRRDQTQMEAELTEEFGEDALEIMGESLELEGADKQALYKKYPWLTDAWSFWHSGMEENENKSQARQGKDSTLESWLKRLGVDGDVVDELFDALRYGVEKDEDGVLRAKKHRAVGEGKDKKDDKKKGKADPLRALKDKYYGMDIDGKCLFLNSEEGAPLAADFAAKYPDNQWWIGCGQRRGGGRSYGGFAGGFSQQTPFVRAEDMNASLWDLRGVPKYSPPDDRSRFWPNAGDSLRWREMAAWRPPR